MPLTIQPPLLPHSDLFKRTTIDTQGIDILSDTLGSPTAPEFSPITPKVDPLLPVLSTQTSPATNESVEAEQPPKQEHAQPQVAPAAIRPTTYIPQPPPQPFSSAESSDGLALKAAISSLQYQRQKARDDLKSLDQIRNLALADPEAFAKELAVGRLREKREDFGSADEVANSSLPDTARTENATSLPGIPGPQNVVRMPQINWDKYHVIGEALDSLHDQQKRWPGSLPFQQDRGREAAVMAPYSPFQDLVDGQPRHSRNSSDTSKKDSCLVATPTTLEHPYETRRSSSKYQP